MLGVLSKPWTPKHRAPYAWWDVHLGGSATQITDSSGNDRAAATNGATTAAAFWLPYDRPKLHLPPDGVNSLATSAPDCPNLSAPGDLSMRMTIKVDSLGAVGSTHYLWRLGDHTGGGVLPWITTLGNIVFASYNGEYDDAPCGSIVPYLGQWIQLWFKYQHGAPAAVTCYYRLSSSLPLASNVGWTQLGSGLVTGHAALNPATSWMYVAGDNGGGTVHLGEYAMWKNATPSGNPVAQWSAFDTSQTQYVDPINGHTWTINRNPTGHKSVIQSPASGTARGLYLFGENDHLTIPVHPDMSQAWSAMIAFRQHADIAAGERIVSWGAGSEVSTFYRNTPSSVDHFYVDGNAARPSPDAGDLIVAMFGAQRIGDGSTSRSWIQVNGATRFSQSGLGASVNPTLMEVGRSAGAGTFGNFELYGMSLYDDGVVSEDDFTRFAAYYGAAA